MKNNKIIKITITAMMMALCYVGANFIKFDVATPFGMTKFHLGNTFCILGALILGGYYGGIAGGFGMCIGDLLDPAYIASAPKTIILKFIIGFIAGTMAHKVFKINDPETKNVNMKVFISAACGAFANVLIEPAVSYLYYLYILGLSEKAAGAFKLTKIVTTTTNAILASIIAPILYFAIKKASNKDKFESLAK